MGIRVDIPETAKKYETKAENGQALPEPPKVSGDGSPEPDGAKPEETLGKNSGGAGIPCEDGGMCDRRLAGDLSAGISK